VSALRCYHPRFQTDLITASASLWANETLRGLPETKLDEDEQPPTLFKRVVGALTGQPSTNVPRDTNESDQGQAVLTQAQRVQAWANSVGGN
jgi:hypothetical protein